MRKDDISQLIPRTKADPGPSEQGSRTSGSELLQVSGLGRVCGAEWVSRRREGVVVHQGRAIGGRCIEAHARQTAVESRARDGLEP